MYEPIFTWLETIMFSVAFATMAWGACELRYLKREDQQIEEAEQDFLLYVQEIQRIHDKHIAQVEKLEQEVQWLRLARHTEP